MSACGHYTTAAAEKAKENDNIFRPGTVSSGGAAAALLLAVDKAGEFVYNERGISDMGRTVRTMDASDGSDGGKPPLYRMMAR
jgi:hypothetical protein